MYFTSRERKRDMKNRRDEKNSQSQILLQVKQEPYSQKPVMAWPAVGEFQCEVTQP